MKLDLEEARARVAGLARVDGPELRDDLASLARPRLSGTQSAHDIERLLRRQFQEHGYEVEALPFAFSSWPGRFGLPVCAALFALAGGYGAWMVAVGQPVAALVALLLGAVLSLAPLHFLGQAIGSLPWGRIETANLLFRRPGADPSWIVMAHRDSKSQLVPTLFRTGAIVAAVAGWVVLVGLAFLWLVGEPYLFPTAAAIAGTILVLGALVLVMGWAGNTSPGALDNASGLAVLLALARRKELGGEVAFLVTDGEELGLAGARAVVSQLPPVQGVVNVDGLDDDGSFYVAEGRGWSRRGTAPQLAAALLTAGEALGLPVERRPLPRSLLVDHLPIAAAGIPALTVLRGRWSSLLRVHRPDDSMEHLRGDGAADGVLLLAAAFHLLREDSAHLAARRRAGS